MAGSLYDWFLPGQIQLRALENMRIDAVPSVSFMKRQVMDAASAV